MKKLLLYSTFFILTSAVSSQPLYWITPKNGHQHINNISFYSPTDGMAVCDDGVILRFSDGNWTRMQSPVTTNLMDIDMLSSNYAMACGNNGVILAYNGNTWTNVATPDYRQLTDISVIDENNAYAAGAGGIIHYNGTQWSDTEIDDDIDCIDFLNANEGWAVGFDIQPVLWHYHNGTWTRDNSYIGSELIFFDDITIINPQHAIMTGHLLEGDGIQYEYNGTEWQTIGAASNNGSSFTTDTSGYGIVNRIGPWFDEYPAIYKYTNGLWAEEYAGLYNEVLTSVTATGENEAFVSTAEGFVYHGLAGDWNISNGFTADNILDISFTEDNNGYFACGSEGIWHYYAGIWTHELEAQGYTFNVVESFNYEVWASAYRETEIPGIYDVVIYRKINDNWSVWTSPFELYTPVTSLTYLTTYTSGNQINYTDGVHSEQVLLSPVDSITSFGEITIIVDNNDLNMGLVSTKRSDGNFKGAIYSKIFGEEWVLSYETTTAQFNDVKAFRYSTEAYAVGNNGLIAYFNGNDWTELPPLTTDDLLSVGFENQYNTGWAVGKHGTTLYYDGNTWSLVPAMTDKELTTVVNHSYPFDVNISLIGGKDGTLLADVPSLPTHRNERQILNNQPLSVFPNPSSGDVTITLSNKHKGTLIFDVYDLTGKRLISGKLNDADNDREVRLNLKRLLKGTYLIKVTSDSMVQSGKMVIFQSTDCF